MTHHKYEPCIVWTQLYDVWKWGNRLTLKLNASLLGLMGREPAHQTSEPGSNPSWDAMVHPVCETFSVMRVV